MSGLKPITVYELCTSRSDRERVLSPFVWRTVLALKHKGFDLKRIPITFTEKDLIAFSKQSLVPVIIDPNNPSVPFVNDSNKIAKYLDDQYPNLPSLKGPAPALNEFIVAWVGTTIQPLMAKLTFDDARELLDEDGKKWYYSEDRGKIFGYKNGMPKLMAPIEQRDSLIKELRRALEPVRAVVKHHKFIGGDSPVYADYTLMGSFLWVRAVSKTSAIMLEPSDPVYQWRSRMLDLFDGLARKARGFHDYDGPTGLVGRL